MAARLRPASGATPRQLAIVRSLWETRDRIAQARDIAPGRVLPDSAIVEAALTGPTTVDALAEIGVFGGRATRRSLAQWFAAIETARALPDNELPPAHVVASGPPPARSWPERDPAAAARLSALRSEVSALAEAVRMPTENLLAPESLRRLAWSPPDQLEDEVIASALRHLGAREWQIELTAKAITQTLCTAAETPAEVEPDAPSD